MGSGRKAANREVILDGALAVFAERGYDAARIEDIARAAGVSRATFYNHFSEREEVLASLFERLLAATGEQAPLAEMPSGRPALDEIVQVAGEAVRRMITRPDLARLLYSLPVRQEAMLKPDRPATPTVFRTIHHLLEAASARGELRSDVPLDLMCVHVHNALESAMRAWADGETDDPVARVRTLVELALYGVAATAVG